ncbi:MAG TPA: sigma-70 family RNA polymerase sigma factor [Candidatus Polarisedimenticolia bacterium]|nr:sigma-70 family RNA polymerase sigma factor [Candidatus Polarisedimenticolia bacterium]
MKPESLDQEFLEFLNGCQLILRRVCRAYADSPEDREDLFQEMVYQLWKSYPTFRGESSPGTWVYSVALNTAISALRRRTRTRTPTALEAAQEPMAPASGGDSRQVDLLYGLIQRLNQVDRALVLLYLEELSYKEIASILGISENHVGVRLNRIKARLQGFAREMQ